MSVEQAATAETALAGPAAKRGETRVLGPIAVGLALLSAFVTFLVLADLTPISPTHYVVVTLLLVERGDGAPAARHHRARGLAGGAGAPHAAAPRARLHVRIVGLFSIIAAAPAILVAIVASVTLDRGLDRLFSTRTRAAIENSLIVAEAYLRDHAADRALRHHGRWRSTSRAPSRCSTRTATSFTQFLTFQASVRGLAAAIVIDDDLNVIARADLKINQTFAHAAARRAAAHQRQGAADRAVARHQLRRGHRQAARTTTTPIFT